MGAQTEWGSQTRKLDVKSKEPCKLSSFFTHYKELRTTAQFAAQRSISMEAYLSCVIP